MYRGILMYDQDNNKFKSNLKGCYLVHTCSRCIWIFETGQILIYDAQKKNISVKRGFSKKDININETVLRFPYMITSIISMMEESKDDDRTRILSQIARSLMEVWRDVTKYEP
jgi:hypothetical protein